MLPLSIADLPRRSLPIVTLGIILLNVIIFIFELTPGGSLQDFIMRAGLVPAEYLCRCDIPPKVIENCFKWLTLGLLAYVGSALFAHPNWTEVLRGTFVPRLSFDAGYVSTVVAFCGRSRSRRSSSAR